MSSIPARHSGCVLLRADSYRPGGLFQRIKLVRIGPVLLTAGLHPQVDVRLGAEGAANRPVDQLSDGLAARNPHASTRLAILQPNVVVARGISKSLQFGEDALALLQFFLVDQFAPVD